MAIGKERKAAKFLAGLVLLLGLAMAIPTLSAPERDLTRSGEVALMDAMQTAHQPTWIAFLNPVIGAVGVMIGACLKKKQA
ncbi:MAG: hypothetical protein P1R58_03155 [bacterium]|nr:hypothetical protein [bacterium]